MSPKEVLEFAQKNEAKQLDLRFTDLPGVTQHVSYPISMLEEDVFEDGFGIDGSSIRGWAAINESDMLIIPDPDTAFMDPFGETQTMVMLGNIVDPITRQHYDRDPRWIAKKAELYLNNSGIADTAYLRRGSGILHLRQHPVRPEPALRLLFHRCRRRALEFRPRRKQPGLPAALQGRLLPRPAD